MLRMGLTVLDLSAYAGLAAVGAVTLNMLLGLLMAFRYSPHRSWPHRRFIYFAAAALFWHSLFTDPALKNAPVDWFDGGKLLVEACLLLIAATSWLRLRHVRKKAFHARQIA